MGRISMKSFHPPPEALPPEQPVYVAPFLGMPPKAVEVALDLAGLKPGELFCDLGAGDGRMLYAAARRGALAIGVELKAELVDGIRKRVTEEGLDGKVYVTHGDLYRFDYMRQADVVYTFLDDKGNEVLKSRLERTLSPGTRVVTFRYKIPGWKPVKRVKVSDPEGKAAGVLLLRTLYLYVFGQHVPEEAPRQALLPRLTTMGLRNMMIIVWKEFLHIKRDRRACLLLIALPIFAMAISNYSFGEIKEIPAAIVDQDEGPVAKMFLDVLRKTDTFKVVFEGGIGEQDARGLVLNKTVHLAIILPSGLSQSVDENKQANITIYYDETDHNFALSIKRGLLEIMQNATEALLKSKLSQSKINLQTKPLNYIFDSVYGYGDLQYINFITPPIMAFTVTFVSIAITSMSIVREKTARTLERVLLSPIRESEFLLGKLMASILVTIGEVLLILATAFLVFQMPVVGSVLLVFFIGFLIGCGGLGLGLAASAMAKRELEAVMVIPAYIIPSLLLSGFFRPIEAISSPVMRTLSRFVPMTYANQALRAIMVKGLGILDIMPDILALTAFAVITLSIGILVFRREMVAQV